MVRTGDIASEGTITPGSTPPFVGFQAYKSSANLIVSSGVAQDVQFSQETYDIGSNFNTTTYSFTAPVNGYYDFKANIQWSGIQTNCSQFLVRLVLTGQLFVGDYIAGIDDFSMLNAIAFYYQSVAATAYMTAGDTCKVEVLYTGTTGVVKVNDGGGPAATRFQGFLIGT